MWTHISLTPNQLMLIKPQTQRGPEICPQSKREPSYYMLQVIYEIRAHRKHTCSTHWWGQCATYHESKVSYCHFPTHIVYSVAHLPSNFTIALPKRHFMCIVHCDLWMCELTSKLIRWTMKPLQNAIVQMLFCWYTWLTQLNYTH